jgi:hypothetical protein
MRSDRVVFCGLILGAFELHPVTPARVRASSTIARATNGKTARWRLRKPNLVNSIFWKRIAGTGLGVTKGDGVALKAIVAEPVIACMFAVSIPLRSIATTIRVGVLGQKFVSGSMNRMKMNRMRGVSLHFLPQLRNLIIDAASRGIVLVTPHLVQQFIT